MRRVFELLRNNPMTVNTLVDAVIQAKGLIDSQANNVESMIRDILSKQKHRGLLANDSGVWRVV